MSCPRENKWFGGCKLEPRYDTFPQNLYGKIRFGSKDSFTDLYRAMAIRIYVGDVCKRCGKSFPRQTEVFDPRKNKGE